MKLAPSFLSADFLNLGDDVVRMNACTDLCHMDIMDGSFVPHITYGTEVVEAVGRVSAKPLDVHLMVVNPVRHALFFAKLPNVEMVSFHLEALEQPDELLSQLHAAGVKAGVAINPDYPLEKLYPHLPFCDFVLVMSVFAGKGGQKFIPESLERIKRLKEEILRRSLNVEIEVDGGVNPSNAEALRKAGADILVAGTALFKAEDLAAAAAAMR